MKTDAVLRKRLAQLGKQGIDITNKGMAMPLSQLAEVAGDLTLPEIRQLVNIGTATERLAELRDGISGHSPRSAGPSDSLNPSGNGNQEYQETQEQAARVDGFLQACLDDLVEPANRFALADFLEESDHPAAPAVLELVRAPVVFPRCITPGMGPADLAKGKTAFDRNPYPVLVTSWCSMWRGRQVFFAVVYGDTPAKIEWDPQGHIQRLSPATDPLRAIGLLTTGLISQKLGRYARMSICLRCQEVYSCSGAVQIHCPECQHR